MFCPNCGNKLPDGTKFCSSCGTQLTDTPSTTQPSAPVYQQPSADTAKPKSKKGLKIAGWILVAMDLIVLIDELTKGTFMDRWHDGNRSWYVAFFLIGIIGVILLIKAYKKEK